MIADVRFAAPAVGLPLRMPLTADCRYQMCCCSMHDTSQRRLPVHSATVRFLSAAASRSTWSDPMPTGSAINRINICSSVNVCFFAAFFVAAASSST